MIRTFGRIAAAAALVVATVATAAVVSTSSAGAANTNVTANCNGSATPQTIDNSDTVTFTMGSGCGAVIFMAGTGASGSAEVLTPFQFTLSTGTPFGGLSVGDTVKFTAPAVGSGSMTLGFMANAQSPPAISYTISYPIPAPRNDSITDNGDGTMTVSYSPVVAPETVYLNLFAPGITCDPTGNPTNRLFGISNFSNQSLPVFAASPAVLSVGSPMRSGWSNTTVASTLTAGSYQACLYYNSGNQQNSLVQSLAVTIGSATPTTSPAGDPVVPAFTG